MHVKKKVNYELHHNNIDLWQIVQCDLYLVSKNAMFWEIQLT
jgi:hypothetical protein